MIHAIVKIFLDVLLPLLDICTDIHFTIELKLHRDPLFIASGNIYLIPIFATTFTTHKFPIFNSYKTFLLLSGGFQSSSYE